MISVELPDGQMDHHTTVLCHIRPGVFPPLHESRDPDVIGGDRRSLLAKLSVDPGIQEMQEIGQKAIGGYAASRYAGVLCRESWTTSGRFA